LLVLAATLVALYAICVFVLPSIRTIFSDMGVDLPGVSRLVFAGFAGHRFLATAAAALPILVGVPLAAYTKFRPRRADSPRPLSRVGDYLKWRLPVLHWFEWNYSLLQTISLLRLAINAGQPLDQAIAAAAELDTNGCYRKRLKCWHALVGQGQDVASAARYCRLGSQLAWAFDQQTNPANAPAVLEMLELFYATRYGYAANLARFIFWPLLIVALAAMVGLVVYAIFSPLVVLIDVTTSAILP
jgi:type IV pilus assembly protein PilC